MATTVGVVTFPGSNCDADFRYAIDATDGLQARALWHKDADLGGVDAVVLPGGFSYGDYLRCGAIARFSPIMAAVTDFAASGAPVLGVCNGFQILCEAGLLPGVLVRNASLSFVCRDVFLRAEGRDTPFTRHLQRTSASADAVAPVVRIPIAHGEGSWQADPVTLERVQGEGQVVLRYAEADGRVTAAANPNGSWRGVAGVCSAKGNVLGLMPHPERAVAPELGGVDGRLFLTSLQEALS